MEIPCDQKCMNATGGKGRRPSNEEIEIFRLKCRDEEKYCPIRLGCVGKKESCAGNEKLDVPLGNRPGEEKKAFCRLRNYICPRYLIFQICKSMYHNFISIINYFEFKVNHTGVFDINAIDSIK